MCFLLNALEQGVLERDAHIQHLNTLLQQLARQAQSGTTSVPLPDLHREMLARVKEFDGDESLKIVRNVAVGEGKIVLHRLLAEYQPKIVNRHLGLLMSTMNWSIRPTDLQSGERMVNTVKRGVLLKRFGTPS